MGNFENNAVSDWGNSTVNTAQADLDALNAQIRDVGIDVALTACSAVPGAGIACDAASLGVSLARGDWLGAGLDLIGFVPIIGDGIKAGVKGGKALGTMRDLERALSVAQDSVNAARRTVAQGVGALRSAARAAGKMNDLRKQAARRYWRLQRERERRRLQRAYQDCKTAACRRRRQQEIVDNHNNPYNNTNLPKSGEGFGRWQGSPGHGKFIPEAGTPMHNAIADYNAKNGTNLDGVEFKQGFPDFSPYRSQSVEISNMRGDHRGGHTTGDPGDYGQARNALSDQLGRPWRIAEENGSTWHHNSDGVTMELVDEAVHGAVNHQGGASMMRDTEVF